ncbi:hypothetical protein MAQ5080_02382 [Marinomonas aquimarina]|uniref:Penicillin-binding protein activator LpoB n=1 Tax=Marinomonas aquimarina TaxID=295068 RepID=A0A1A8TKI5_9GAMM|nr:penicillin-binding protein activator LpoB [Marinomonas aquimarina]SBS32862.1 hypothetical protein MAQ5080_02382 [Marinomonas aquimarina]
MLKLKTLAATLLALSITGCTTPTAYINAESKTENIVAGLSYADFKGAADSMADEIIANKMLDHPDERGRYIMFVSDITNDTMQRIDTDQLAKTIRVKLTNSGKFLITNAFTGGDKAVAEMRQLKDSEMVKQSSVKGAGQVYAPDFSLSGKIMQRNNTMDNNDTRIEYYFQLSLTNLENGLSYWEGERVVGKVADGDTVSW